MLKSAPTEKSTEDVAIIAATDASLAKTMIIVKTASEGLYENAKQSCEAEVRGLENYYFPGGVFLVKWK